MPDGYSGEAGDLPPMALVDMPGYGYAKAPKEHVDAWAKLVFDYLRGRATLKRVCVLIDSRHGIKEERRRGSRPARQGRRLLSGGPDQTDKIKPPAVVKLLAETAEKIKKRPAAYPGIIATSSEKSEGLDDLRAAIALTVGVDNWK